MPSKIEHEILKLRGEISSTGKVYTDSIADVRDDLTDTEIDIKELQSASNSHGSGINSVKTLASKALIFAKTPLPQRVRKFVVKSHYSNGGAGYYGDHLDKAATQLSYFNFKLPEDCINIIDIYVVCRRANACATGDVCLELELHAGAVNQSHDSHDYSDVLFPTITGANHHKIVFDCAGLTLDKDDYITFKVQRTGGSGGDTLDEDLVITVIEVEYLAEN